MQTDMTAELQRLFETLDLFVAELELGRHAPTNSKLGQGYERDIELCAGHMMDRIAKLSEVYREDRMEAEREARMEGGPNRMSGAQLGISRGRAW